MYISNSWNGWGFTLLNSSCVKSVSLSASCLRAAYRSTGRRGQLSDAKRLPFSGTYGE